MPEQSKNGNNPNNAQEKMVRGSMWMSFGSIFSRLIGAIYVIPWYAWMGENGNVANSLFNKGYNIYALFLMIATAGIPSAIAKQIAYYNSLNEYRISKRLFKRSLLLMTGLGILFAGAMFFAAPLLAGGDKDLIPTMRALSAAVLIFPCMSIIRGFFQGYQDMMPSAVSQVMEQVIRVLYMLLATFIIMKVLHGSYVQAVTQSTFAAFVGMLASFAILFWYYRKELPRMRYLEKNSNNQIKVTENALLKEIVIEAIPFVVVGSGITIFKLVDQMTFEPIMRSFTGYTDRHLSELFSIFSANPDKLTMITISLATALATAGLPLITEAYAQKDRQSLAKQVSENIQLFFFVMIPSTLGMVVLAMPLNTLFYKSDLLGKGVLVQACYVGLVLGFFMLMSTMLQGLYRNKEAMLYFGYGLIVKIILQYPFIRFFEVYGPLLATAVGFIVTCYFTTKEIRKITRFNVSLTARRTLLITIFSVIMMIGAAIVKLLTGFFLSPERKVTSLLMVLIVALVGGAIYAYLALKVRLADKLLGRKQAIRLRRKIGIK